MQSTTRVGSGATIEAKGQGVTITRRQRWASLVAFSMIAVVLPIVLASPAYAAPPTAGDDNVNVFVDSSFDPFSNDGDTDGDPLDFAPGQSFTTASGDTVICDPVVSGPPSSVFCVVDSGPAPGATDSWTYTITDGVDTATATVTIENVDYTNTPPTAIDDVLSLEEDTTVTFAPTTNDLDDDPTFELVVTSITSAAGNVVSCALPGAPPDAVCTYTAPPGSGGTTDTLTYTIEDTSGATDTATVAVTILAVAPAETVLTVTKIVTNPGVTRDFTVRSSRPSFFGCNRGNSGTIFSLAAGETSPGVSFPPGQRRCLNESGAAGYEISWSCTGANTGTLTGTGDIFDFTPSPLDASIACTVTNTIPGQTRLTIVTDQVGEPDRTYDFSTSGLVTSSFSLAPGSAQVLDLPFDGTVTVTETQDRTRFFLLVRCEDDNTGAVVRTGGGTNTLIGRVEVPLTAGRQVTCTFTNTLHPTLTLTHTLDTATPGPAFGYNGSPGSSFISSTPRNYSLTNGQTGLYSLSTGRVFELTPTSVPPNYILDSVTCVQRTDAGTTAYAPNSIDVDPASPTVGRAMFPALTSNEQLECSWAWSRAASELVPLTITKDYQAPDASVFGDATFVVTDRDRDPARHGHLGRRGDLRRNPGAQPDDHHRDRDGRAGHAANELALRRQRRHGNRCDLHGGQRLVAVVHVRERHRFPDGHVESHLRQGRTARPRVRLSPSHRTRRLRGLRHSRHRRLLRRILFGRADRGQRRHLHHRGVERVRSGRDRHRLWRHRIGRPDQLLHRLRGRHSV